MIERSVGTDPGIVQGISHVMQRNSTIVVGFFGVVDGRIPLDIVILSLAIVHSCIMRALRVRFVILVRCWGHTLVIYTDLAGVTGAA